MIKNLKQPVNSYSRYYAGHKYLTELKQFFLKKGGKSKMESLFKEYMINPIAKKTKGWSQKTQEKFIKCEQNSTPYVKLRIRKRGKRIKYRVTYLEKKRWLKKALLPFSKVVREKKMDRFLVSFDKELENLSSGRSSVMVKRDEFHKLALAKAPYSWKRKKVKKSVVNEVNPVKAKAPIKPKHRAFRPKNILSTPWFKLIHQIYLSEKIERRWIMQKNVNKYAMKVLRARTDGMKELAGVKKLTAEHFALIKRDAEEAAKAKRDAEKRRNKNRIYGNKT